MAPLPPDARVIAPRAGAPCPKWLVIYPAAEPLGDAMQIGIIGHESANARVAKRWLEAGYQVIGFDPHHEPGKAAWPPGMMLVDRFDDLAIALSPPRTLWMALRSRAETEHTYNALLTLLGRGDTVIDAGRSYYKDTLRRALVFSRFQYWLIDVGVCEAWPLTDGRRLAIGGERSTIEQLGGVFDALEASGAQGWGRIGQEGAGHFARMLHDAMTLAMAQVAAEGFMILGRKTEPVIDLRQLATLWSHGDEARNCLLNLATADRVTTRGLTGAQDAEFDEISEAQWVLEEASELRGATPLLAGSLLSLLREPSP